MGKNEKVNVILYHKELKVKYGSTNAALLFTQLNYWIKAMKGKPIYKSLSPQKNKNNLSQSWCEELAFSADEFRNAFKLIGIPYKSKTIYDNNPNKFIDIHGKEFPFCSYYNRDERKTYYFRNDSLVNRILNELGLGKSAKAISVNQESPRTEIGKGNLEYNTETTSDNNEDNSNSNVTITTTKLSIKDTTTVENISYNEEQFSELFAWALKQFTWFRNI